MTDEEKILKAVAELLGVESYTPSRGQSTKIREGHTAEEIIKGLPLQLEDLKYEAAKGLNYYLGSDDVTPDIVKPYMVAHLLRLNMYIKGFSSNVPEFVARDMRREHLMEIATEVAKKKYDFWGNLYKKHLNREPDKEGLKWWTTTIEHWFKKGIK